MRQKERDYFEERYTRLEDDFAFLKTLYEGLRQHYYQVSLDVAEVLGVEEPYIPDAESEYVNLGPSQGRFPDKWRVLHPQMEEDLRLVVEDIRKAQDEEEKALKLANARKRLKKTRRTKKDEI